MKHNFYFPKNKKKILFTLFFCYRLGKHPEKTADLTKLPHDKFARIVMFAGVIIVALYFHSTRDVKSKAVMAKQSEVIEEKRYHQLLCAPSFKKEIQDLGNKSEFYQTPTACSR